MCEEGVRRFIDALTPDRVRELLARAAWEPVHDGFGVAPGGGADVPRRLRGVRCEACHQEFVAVRRPLIACAYNLPDAAIYQAVALDAPCIALGEVTDASTRSSAHREGWQRWQGLLWQLFRVAFVVVDGDTAFPFRPLGIPGADPQVAARLARIADAAGPKLSAARAAGTIPALDAHGRPASRPTESALKPILDPVFLESGYRAVPGQQSARLPYWRHDLDFLYRGDSGDTIAVEVKVGEDWDHPLGGELASLVDYSAVLRIRVPPDARDGARDVRAEIAHAESIVEQTGRARFICVWPPSAPSHQPTRPPHEVSHGVVQRTQQEGTAMTGTAPRWNRNSWTPLYRPDGAEWLEGAVEEVEALCREHGWRLDTARNQEGVSFKCSNRIRFRVEVPRGARKAHVLDDGQPFPQTLATWRYVKSYSAGQLNWVVYASSAPHARVADLVEVLTPVCR